MTDYHIEGYPAGSADLAATQTGRSGGNAATITAPAVAFAGEGRFVQRPSQRWNGMSATIASIGNNYATGFHAQTALFLGTVREVDGNRVDLNLGESDWQVELWIGAEADVYRVVSGEMIHVGTATVVGGNLGSAFMSGANDTTAYTQAGGFGFYSESVGIARTRWYGVAAVDAGGQIGEIGWAAYTPAHLDSGSQPSNTDTVSLGVPYSEGGALPAPGNVAAVADASGPRRANLTWDAVPGAVGYLPFQSTRDPATHPDFRHLEMAPGGPTIQLGDMVILRHRVMNPTTEMLGTRAGKAFSIYRVIRPTLLNERLITGVEPDVTVRLIPFAGSAPAADAGDDYLELELGAGFTGNWLLQQYWHGPEGSGYDQLIPGETYRLEFWVRASAPCGITANMDVPGVGATAVSVTTAWQKVTVNAVATVQAGGPSPFRITYDTPGVPVVLHLAGLVLRRASVPLNGFGPELASRMPAGMALRDHALIKIGDRGYFIDEVTAPIGFGYRAHSVHAFLQNCLTLGLVPWLQLEWILRPAEWADFMAYLAAPVASGHPMALRRQANGRSAPWTDAFDRVLFEFGNEAWNTLSEFLNPPSMTDAATSTVYGQAAVYGLIARLAAQAMQGSPWFSPKMEWVLGGWSRNSFGADAAETFRLPCEVGIANYNGGWDEGGNKVTEAPASYQNVMAVAPGSLHDAMDGEVDRLAAVAAASGGALVYGQTLRPTCYEAGPGYQLNGLNGATLTSAERIVQEVVMKSRAAATGTLDTVLSQAERGFSRYNFFTIGEGDYWKSHAEAANGGATYPSWQVCQVLHEQMGASDIMASLTVYDAGATTADPNGGSVAVDAVFAFGLRSLDRPDRVMLVVGNRDVSRTVLPTICTALSSAASCTVFANVGDYREHNRYPPGQRRTTAGGLEPDAQSVAIAIAGQPTAVPADLSRIVVDASLGATAAGLPPGCCVMIQLDGAT